jgi:hypothetical protein
MFGDKICPQNILEDIKPRDTHNYRNERASSN